MLKLQNISYIKNDLQILSIPDFECMKGEIMGVMGPNGAGKSSLLKICAFLEKATDGSIFLNGHEVSTHTLPLFERRKLAVVMQQSLLFNTNVFENIAIGLKFRKLSKPVIMRKVEEWMDRFQISHLATQHTYHLSGGEAQRVNLARAMVLEPEILFLDEPFSALDFPTKVTLLKDLKAILDETKTTTFFISHDLTEIKYMTNSLTILMNGRITESGRTESVISYPNLMTARFLEQWNL
jgi:tungstate transport system ATP-binding protein